MIEFPASSPHDPEITKLIQDLAEATLDEGVLPELKIFWYYDDQLERSARDTLTVTEEFEIWFEKYYADAFQQWERSYLVVYSDTVPGRDELRFHVVLGEDLPVYALCVNRKTGQAQWYLQETPTATKLAEKRK